MRSQRSSSGAPFLRRHASVLLVLFSIVASFFGTPAARAADHARQGAPVAMVASHGHARLVALRAGQTHVEHARTRRTDDNGATPIALSNGTIHVARADFARASIAIDLEARASSSQTTVPFARGPPPSA